MKVINVQSLLMATLAAAVLPLSSAVVEAAPGADASGKINFTPRELNRCEAVRQRALSDERNRIYDKAFPVYVEICAASTWQKRGASDGGNYGHAFGLIKGACVVRDEKGIPVIPQQLQRCDGGEVGISSDYIFFNVQWTAVEGRSFMLYGDHAPSEPLDQTAALKIQKEAHRRGAFTGVEYQKTYRQEIADKASAAGMSVEDYRKLWQGDASMGTDFAVAAARGGVDCTRIPIVGNKPGAEYKVLDDLIAHLNRKNRETYEAAHMIPMGKTEPVGFDYDGAVNNCTTNFYNALASVGYWSAKDTSGHPTGTFELLFERLRDTAAPYDVMFGAYKMGNILDINFLIKRFRSDKQAFQYFKDTGWMGPQVGTMLDPIPALEYMNSVYDTSNLTHFATVKRELQMAGNKLLDKVIGVKLPVYSPEKAEFEAVRRDLSGPASNLVENLKKWRVIYTRALSALNGRRDQDEVVQELKAYITKKLDETSALLTRSDELAPTAAPICPAGDHK